MYNEDVVFSNLSRAEQGVLEFLSLSEETTQQLYELFCNEDVEYRYSDEAELIRAGGSVYAGILRTLERLERREIIRHATTPTEEKEWSLTDLGQRYIRSKT